MIVMARQMEPMLDQRYCSGGATMRAAEAFTRLAARVGAMETRPDGRLAVVGLTLESVAAEKRRIEVPDYSPTLGKINANMAEFAKRLKAVEQSEALRITPESMVERIAAAAEAARDAHWIALKDTRELNRQTIAAMNQATGTLRAKDDQRRHLLYVIGGAILAISLLWLIYPGWAASLALNSWQWPERVARRTMGEPTLWDAGIRLMRAGNPEGWQTIVDAAELRSENKEAIRAYKREAVKRKKQYAALSMSV